MVLPHSISIPPFPQQIFGSHITEFYLPIWSFETAAADQHAWVAEYVTVSNNSYSMEPSDEMFRLSTLYIKIHHRSEFQVQEMTWVKENSIKNYVFTAEDDYDETTGQVMTNYSMKAMDSDFSCRSNIFTILSYEY